MININPQFIRNMGPGYCNSMIAGIQQRYNAVTGAGHIAVNPFTGDPFTALMENGRAGTMDVNLVKDLLTATFDEICSKYDPLHHYFLTCKLIFLGSFKIDSELQSSHLPINQSNREQFRKDFVAEYDNPWVTGLLAAHPHYFKNSKNFKRLIESAKAQMAALNANLMRIVDYNSHMDADLRHDILSQIPIEVCPYCNRQYITRYQDGKRLKTTADLDHFYPNSVFKLFSLSLFNFVPACQLCNSRFKLAKGADIVYPYGNGFGDEAYFEVKLNSGSTIDSMIGNNMVFDLKIVETRTGPQTLQVRNSIEMFEMEKVYQSHKEHVRELLYKKNAYSNTYQKQLEQLFSSMKLSKSEINLFLYGNELQPDQFGKRPLSKLTYDIVARGSS